MNLPKRVTLKEVGPRDGLQNEKKFVTTEQKVEWINQLSESGLSHIEVSSFVHPKWIPALSDAEQVFQQIHRHSGVTYSALIPNIKGAERALQVGVDEFAVFMSASETHNRKNINKSIEDTYSVLKEVANEGKSARKNVRGYVSTVFGCPYDGHVSLEEVKKICDKLFSIGVYEISLGDTIGVANPQQVEEVIKEVKKEFGVDRFALHFHDTRGMALANTLVGLQLGVKIFDGSIGGLGGCPYAKGASGNVASEDLLFMLHEMGIETGVDAKSFLKAATFIEDVLQKTLPSHQLKIAEGMS
ncbi:hydroxymethylglutaryl-CoA lyase [Salipaludibacillus keqinensis]|uniref:Hydroxymethylglutaryl-CoA lyase n=1 Tax=Salipaludibacillus keqinensis TaxID=2045207 RepID=A0A323TWY1_9BACI|nr:hydroxymethylglutaryl-CoA lyase [Salipaludibacillus keqinensis]PYZ94085.1 hydroxymethylglutaryl-CoA lyase [Salipaludibacillus keqinensis]